MKKIVSYAWFRHEASIYESPKWNAKKVGRQFEQFLPLILRAHFIVWPNWQIRIAYDNAVTKLPYFAALRNLHSNIWPRYISGPSTLCGMGGMLERVEPAFRDWDYVTCRDVDSIPLPRDYDAVEEFIESGKALHVIHSVSAHSGLMGGLTTINGAKWREKLGTDFQGFLNRWGSGLDMNVHGADQRLLNRLPEVFGDDILIHELDHLVGDLPGEVRTSIRRSQPSTQTEKQDSFSKIVGGCEEPLEPFLYYNSLDLPIIRRIQDCERRAGVDAEKLIREIRAL